jgi:hypothetical protein
MVQRRFDTRPGPNSARVVSRFTLDAPQEALHRSIAWHRPTRANDATETSLPATGACAAV